MARGGVRLQPPRPLPPLLPPWRRSGGGGGADTGRLPGAQHRLRGLRGGGRGQPHPGPPPPRGVGPLADRCGTSTGMLGGGDRGGYLQRYSVPFETERSTRFHTSHRMSDTSAPISPLVYMNIVSGCGMYIPLSNVMVTGILFFAKNLYCSNRGMNDPYTHTESHQ